MDDTIGHGKGLQICVLCNVCYNLMFAVEGHIKITRNIIQKCYLNGCRVTTRNDTPTNSTSSIIAIIAVTVLVVRLIMYAF
jgi:hypothetical protein